MDQPTQQDGDTINDQMAKDIELRRQAQPERRKRRDARPPGSRERRRLCAFCYQPGDHQTAAQCLRSLER